MSLVVRREERLVLCERRMLDGLGFAEEGLAEIIREELWKARWPTWVLYKTDLIARLRVERNISRQRVQQIKTYLEVNYDWLSRGQPLVDAETPTQDDDRPPRQPIPDHFSRKLGKYDPKLRDEMYDTACQRDALEPPTARTLNAVVREICAREGINDDPREVRTHAELTRHRMEAVLAQFEVVQVVEDLAEDAAAWWTGTDWIAKSGTRLLSQEWAERWSSWAQQGQQLIRELRG